MKDMVKALFIPYNTPSSKNSRVWTGTHSVVSKAVRKWRKDTAEYWVSYRDVFREELVGLEMPYFIHFTFRRGSRRIFDYDNISQVVKDEMVRYGWIPDDNADVIVPCFGKYSYDKEAPGVIIRVLREKPIYKF